MSYISEGDVLTADLIEKLQADMVSIDTATNPAVKKINSRFSKAKKYCLETTYTKITPAINELNVTQQKLTDSLTQTVNSVASVMGNTTENPELKTRFEECVTALSTVTDVTVLNSVMDILQRLTVVEKFSTDDFEDEFEIEKQTCMNDLPTELFIDGMTFEDADLPTEWEMIYYECEEKLPTSFEVNFTIVNETLPTEFEIERDYNLGCYVIII